MKRADRLRQLVERRRQTNPIFVPFPAWLWGRNGEGLDPDVRAQLSEDFVAQQEAFMAQQKQANAAQKPRPSRTAPSTGAKAPTRWTRCASCGLAAEMPTVFAEGTSRCASCGGGL